MADISTTNGMFSPETVAGLVSKVKGYSSITTLASQMPIAFNGNEIFTFAMDDEAALVGESEKKDAAHMEIAPIKIVPVKIEYGHRVTDEFMFATEEKQLDILTEFVDGFAKKAARAIDIMSIHGVNPRTKAPSTLIQQYLDECTNVVTYDSEHPDVNVDDAIALIGDYDTTGLAMSKGFASAMGKLTTDGGVRLYPELMWGGQPNAVNGVPTSVNNTINFGDSTDVAVVGDFANMFRWGYAKDVPFEVIPYGDPDNTGVDLKGSNQVYLRSEMYVGWGILDLGAFALIQEAEDTPLPTSVKTTSAKASK